MREHTIPRTVFFPLPPSRQDPANSPSARPRGRHDSTEHVFLAPGRTPRFARRNHRDYVHDLQADRRQLARRDLSRIPSAGHRARCAANSAALLCSRNGRFEGASSGRITSTAKCPRTARGNGNLFGMERLPRGYLAADTAVFRTGGIAHNLLAIFKRSALDDGWRRHSVSTRRWPLLYLPGKVVRHGRINAILFPADSRATYERFQCRFITPCERIRIVNLPSLGRPKRDRGICTHPNFLTAVV